MLKNFIFAFLFFTSLLNASSSSASTLVNGYTVVSEDEAYNTVVEYETKLARSQFRAPRTVVPMTDARYNEVKNILAKIWRGYKKTYPQETRGLATPVPVLIEDPILNAYAMYRSATHDIPFLFIIHTAALKSDLAQQLGLYAHELGHLVTKNVNPQVAKSMTKYYFVSEGHEPLGFLQKNNPTVQAYTERYIELAGKVGPLARRNLNGIVLNIFGSADYGVLQNYLMNTYMVPQQKTQPDCQTAADLKQQAINLFTPSFNTTTMTLNLSSEGNAAMSEITQKFNAAMDACVGPSKPDLIKLVAESMGAPVEKIEKTVPAADVTTFNSAPTIWQAVLAITVPREAEFEDIAKNHDLSHTRIYTHEENADEAAARALKSMGRSSQDLASFLYSILPAPDAEKCRATIAVGQTPAYGPLFDPHHSTCYRIYHLQVFDKYANR